MVVKPQIHLTKIKILIEQRAFDEALRLLESEADDSAQIIACKGLIYYMLEKYEPSYDA